MAAEVRKNDIGTIFEVAIKDQDGVIIDVTLASLMKLHFLKPDGTVLSKNATFSTNGSDGLIRYVSVAGDLNVEGDWKVQSEITLATNHWHTDEFTFTVHRNIA